MPSWSADIQAQINAVQTYQYETFTFTKYCEHYIVGYSSHGVQIIKGKCHYGGIRDIGADIGGHYPGDLPAWITGVFTADLAGEIIGLQPAGEGDLGGVIGGHLPVDLGALIGAHDPENLLAYIRGFDKRDLFASITALQYQGLPAEIYSVPPEDLSAYLKVWPMRQLPGSIYGWDTKDLGAYLNTVGSVNLGAIVAGHRPKNLSALIKGWVREATYDLGASIHSYDAGDLGAFIRSSEMAQLPAYLFPVLPKNLQATIMGWAISDLGGIITVAAYPWNLTASIVVSGSYMGLPAHIHGKENVAIPTDLSAYILVTQGRSNLTASTWAQQARNLTASIDPGKDIKNLTAEILPKRIRLTGVLSMVTMEHSDMSATISIPCFYSDLRDLSAYIRPVFKADLGAVIYPKGYVFAHRDLGASFGYAPDSVVQDKLTVNINITPLGFRTEDKYTINLSIFRSGLSLGASITATRPPANLSASIYPQQIVPYNFESWKGRERVFLTTYTQAVYDYEDVDISFKTMVKDYFYSSGSDVVARANRDDHFVTKVASYYSPAAARGLVGRLHKIKNLYDLRHFATIDEAIRYAIWYVTTYPTRDLGASINSIVPNGSSNLSARIGATVNYSTNNDLPTTVTGIPTHPYDVILGYIDDGVDYLEF